MRNLSFTYRFCVLLVSIIQKKSMVMSAYLKLLESFWKHVSCFLLSMMNWVIFEPINPRMLRPFLLRRLGCKVGKGVFIGDHVVVDENHADHIILEDHVHIASGTRLLCHQRDLSNYCVGDDYAKLGYKLGIIHMKKGSLVGMESFIMPGVTIGEGAIVGAGSLITKDIPAWTVAAGRPAKVVKEIPQRISVK